MPRRVKRRFGLPWLGYRSSVPPHMAPIEYATSDGPSSATRRSVNMLYDPQEGKFYRRAGRAVVGATTGILENGTGELTTARARQLSSITSGSLSDGYPTHAALYTEEDYSGPNDKGCVYMRSTNGAGLDYTLGQEFGTTHYPTAAATANNFKALPYMRTTEGTLGRFSSVALRAQAAVGSRRMIEVGDWLYLPNLRGTPWRWNKRFNDASGSGSENLRVWHVGQIGPIGIPSIVTGTLNPDGTWHEGDEFFISVAYRMADGSVSLPIIPREPNAEVNYDPTGLGNMNGFCKVTLPRSSDPWDDRYRFLTWSNIPIGPEGTVGRYLLRTPKKSGTGQGTTATQDGPDPAALDLRITAYIPNNTQTTYQDPNGNDLALVSDPLVVRFDHIMQPPSRYMAAFDQRILCGYTRPSPVAFYLAPNVNASDDSAAIVANVDEFNLTGGVLTIRRAGGAGSTVTCDNTVTIQQVVDAINNKASGASWAKWHAVIAPGADPTALCSTTGSANDNLTSTAGAVLGDATGWVRSYGSSFYAPVFFSTTYLNNFQTEKRRVFFTMGGPGMPTHAANSWSALNFRTAPETWGNFMGAAPLTNGAVCCFTRAIGVLQNRKAGTTGEDQDYRLYELNPSRGCIAWDSIVEFNGAVGYLTPDGFVVTDGREEVLISGDVWNPSTQVGEWAYEIGQCIAGSAADTDLAHFHAKVMGGKLYVTYRLTNAVTIPNRMLVYDFSGSAQYGGLRGVLRSDGSPWGWSTPLNMPLSVLGEVRKSTGALRYGTDESNAGATSNGRVEQFEVNTDDNGSPYTSALWSARMLSEGLKKVSAQEATKLYKKNGTGVQFLAYRDGLGTGTADATLTLATTSTSNFGRAVLPMPQAARSPTASIEFNLTDDGSGPALEHWGFELALLELDTYT